MDEIVVNRKNVTATKNEVQEDFVFRISKHNRGFVVKTSANLELSNTLFLDSERDIAQDIIFNEITRILQTDQDMLKSDTKYVCPKCGKEIMKFKTEETGKSYWFCSSCKYQIPHYKRS